MKKTNKKLYVIRKYVLAKSAREAIKIEKNFETDDVWLDDEWLKNNPRTASAENPVPGFSSHTPARKRKAKQDF